MSGDPVLDRLAPLPRRQSNRLARQQGILQAALTVFAATGYSGATMEAVAAQAGLSKPTLYQYFASKEALFAAMMLSQRDRMLTVFERPSPRGMVQDLWAFAWDYADTVMRPDMLSLARLIIGEVQRFPAIGRAYQASGPDRLLKGMMDYLAVQRDTGRLTFEDAELAAQDLWGLILSAPRTQALYRPDAIPAQTQIHRYIANGLRVFLRAYSTTPSQDLDQLQTLTQSPRTPREPHDA
jgi:TetR/AcrR family transcriptional regulator, mexJK operon transcriptional repressor